MKIKINYGYTFNRGNNESERIDACMEVDVEFADEVNDVRSGLFDELKEFVWQKGGKL